MSHDSRLPERAMVLAAGLGKRMRPITDTCPKPLIRIDGRTLLDRALDCLADAGVERAVINVFHLAGQIIAHVADRQRPHIVISDESGELLDSAGGIVKALPLLGTQPFFVLNADTFWIDESRSNLQELARQWDPEKMDILLMLADMQSAVGHDGKSDFLHGRDGRLTRAKGAGDGLIYAGAALIHPRIFKGAAVVPHSLNIYFDRAIDKGRLFGWRMAGRWITVGTPDAIAAAEAAVAAALAGGE